jgi:Reverse transcriptase (RNA-dependent DNA polymerase)
VVVYLDDIFIYSKTKKEHIKYVIAILKALKKADIKINNTKNIFHV